MPATKSSPVSEASEWSEFSACAIPEPDCSTAIRVIHEWLEKYGLPRLDITNVKDVAMAELGDDRAVGVIVNTGQRADGRS